LPEPTASLVGCSGLLNSRSLIVRLIPLANAVIKKVDHG
jgi:hypothetical protein